MEPNFLSLEHVPDFELFSNEENVTKVMPCCFQGQFVKEMASTWVPPTLSFVLEEASHHAVRTLEQPCGERCPTKNDRLAPGKPSGDSHLALGL